MGVNKRYLEKFDKAYAGIPATIRPIEFMPDSPWYHQEEWREVLPMFVPDVLPHTYWISSWGRVYSALQSPKYPEGSILAHSINQKGYHQINLQSVYGKKIGIKIHKLVLLHFAFIPGCQYLEVDHKDGNKDNNCLWNLEWVDPRENTRRAIRNQQRTISYTKNDFLPKNDSLLTDEQASELFLQAVNKTESKINELAKQYNVSVQFVQYLVRGALRPYIRRNYNRSFQQDRAMVLLDNLMPELSDETAQNIFLEAVGKDFRELQPVADKYNVTSFYVQSLLNGSIRPYIWKNYYESKLRDCKVNSDISKTDNMLPWLPDQIAISVFLESVDKDDSTIRKVSSKYNVPEEYTRRLLNGTIRPHILSGYRNGLLKIS